MRPRSVENRRAAPRVILSDTSEQGRGSTVGVRSEALRPPGAIAPEAFRTANLRELADRRQNGAGSSSANEPLMSPASLMSWGSSTITGFPGDRSKSSSWVHTTDGFVVSSKK